MNKKQTDMNIRNIGVFAHVDAGKTTLSERMLVHAGAVSQAGSVDDGTAHTDTLPIERRRGISVKATCVRLQWKGMDINLIDTPGHTDFSAEIERSLWALDGAVLLADAVEGVQPQTEVLFHALHEQHVPVVFFINKIDRIGANVAEAVAQIRKLLTQDVVLMSDEAELTEYVCGNDDELMEAYLDGKAIARETLMAKVAGWTRGGKCHPVYVGSALKDEGVEALLDAVVDFLPPPPSCGSTRRTADVGGSSWSKAPSRAAKNPKRENRATRISARLERNAFAAKARNSARNLRRRAASCRKRPI